MTYPIDYVMQLIGFGAVVVIIICALLILAALIWMVR